MAAKITRQHILYYLKYLSERTRTPLPDNLKETHFAGLSEDNVYPELQKLYAQIKISNQRAWSIEDQFLKDLVSIAEAEKENNNQYIINDRIGQDNYKEYFTWLARRIQIPLDQNIAILSGADSVSIMAAIQKLYRQIGYAPNAASFAESTFIAEYDDRIKKHAAEAKTTGNNKKDNTQTKTSPPAYQSNTATGQRVAPATPDRTAVERNEPPVRKSTHFDIPDRRKKVQRRIIIVTVFFIFGFAAWCVNQFLNFRNLPNIYPLTDDIVVRSSATDDGEYIAYMDMFGERPDGKGGAILSKKQYKLADRALHNGYFKVLKSDNFFAFLFNLSSNQAYVYSAYVTTSLKTYENMCSIFDEIRGNFNELDKLPYAVRMLLLSSIAPDSNAAPLYKLIPPCSKPKTVSKKSPVFIFKYIRKTANESIVIFQAADSNCYYVRGTFDGKVLCFPQKVITSDSSALPAGGVFSFANGECIYKRCSGGAVYTSSHPYTIFTQKLPNW